MQYLKYTYVDALTGVSCAAEPMRNGPAFPPVPGLQHGFALESEYPTRTPTFYGTAPDDAPTDMPGVLAVLTEAEHEAAYLQEMQTRLESARAQALADVAAERNRRETGGFEYLGKRIQSDPRSAQRIALAAQAAQAAVDDGTAFAIDWTCEDNTALPLNAHEMIGMSIALVRYADALHRHARKLKEAIAAAETLGVLAAVDLAAGWPQ